MEPFDGADDFGHADWQAQALRCAPVPAVVPVVARPAPVADALMLLGDGRDWARQIVNRFRRGEPVGVAQAQFAHEALGLPAPKRARGRR
jgi:hypothetical protein